MTMSSSNWHTNAYFGLHFDLHATKNDTVLGKSLTRRMLRERLLQIRPDWVQCDCKGHPGYTSWPTKIGSASPGIVNDALRIFRDVTAELGIHLGVHYSGVWDTRALELHPTWAVRDAAGHASKSMTCRLGPYSDQLLIPQMLEIIGQYDVDGFWVDGDNWAAQPCWCQRCRREFTRRTGITHIPRAVDDKHWRTWLKFHRTLFVEYVTRYANAVHERKPGCLVCSNWMYTARQPDAVVAPVDYLSGDYTFTWGSERAAIEGRVLDGRGKTWDLMAWGFAKTNGIDKPPQWTVKSATHLKQELSEVIALGGAMMVYPVTERTGWLPQWQNDILAEVAAFCRERQAACFQTQSVPQAAVLHAHENFYSENNPLFNYGSAMEPVEGALHALLETHHPTDILLSDSVGERLSEYELLVIPEQTVLPPQLTEKLETYARGGGHVLMSGAHLSKQYSELIGAKPKRKAVHAKICLSDGVGAVCVSGPWQSVEPGPGTRPLLYRLADLDPAHDATREPVVTQRRVGRGSVVAIHGPLFREYGMGHYPRIRDIIRRILQQMNIAWRVKLQAPPWVEMILRGREERLLINLINRGSCETLSPRRVMVEELPVAGDMELTVRSPVAPVSVISQPEGKMLRWNFVKGAINIRVRGLCVHCVIEVTLPEGKTWTW